MTVQSEKQSRIVSCIMASVEVSMLAVASSSSRIWRNNKPKSSFICRCYQILDIKQLHIDRHKTSYYFCSVNRCGKSKKMALSALSKSAFLDSTHKALHSSI